jgi:hypoxanthine phosphoribosyltransferase
MDKINLTWDEYLGYLRYMSGDIPSQPDVIVGLVRGGLVPSVYLSHALDVPMITFDPHLLHSNGNPREQIYLPISPSIIRTVLIVDDISDTGKTLLKCKKFFSNRGFKVLTTSIYVNSTTTIYTPDFWVKDSEKKWVVFPYEKG